LLFLNKASNKRVAMTNHWLSTEIIIRILMDAL